MAASITLIAAYGHIYRDRASALKDWQEGKDFKILGCGPYCSIRDIKRLEILHNEIWIRLDTWESVRIDT